MPALSNEFKSEIKAIYADVRDPLTVEELRNRLKHIASLCWGLSIDLSTEMSEFERVREENKQLRAQIVVLGGVLPNGHHVIDLAKLEAMTPEECAKYFKRLNYMREYRTRKAKEKAKAAYAGGGDGNG